MTRTMCALVGSAMAVVGIATPAVAASWHGISGTTYSGCPQADVPTWYTSSNARYKSGYGAIKAQFNHIGPNGLGFRVLGAAGNNLGTTKYWTEQETDIIRTLATGIADDKRFYNSFRETGTQCNVGDHEFDGSEYY